jgi:hypothetical protein
VSLRRRHRSTTAVGASVCVIDPRYHCPAR